MKFRNICDLAGNKKIYFSETSTELVGESNASKICCYTCFRRVKRREGRPERFARAIRATDIHPSDASASTVFARPHATGALLRVCPLPTVPAVYFASVIFFAG